MQVNYLKSESQHSKDQHSKGHNKGYQNRLNQLRQRLSQSPYDALLICHAPHCRYLTGFANDDANVAYLLVTLNELFLITDYRYAEQASAECVSCEVIVRDRVNVSLGQQVQIILQQVGANHVAFERDYFHYGLIADIKAALIDVQVSDFCGWIERLRWVKDADEINCIKTAANIADEALANTVSLLKAGISEKEASLELEYQLQKLGSQGMSFPTIFLSGPRSALPHGTPSDRLLMHGDLICIDFGAVVNGYRSDMTRAFSVGKPDDKQLAVYETVKMAQQVGLDSVKAGITGEQPFIEVKKVLDSSPFAQYQGDGLGHGVGLVLHEQPFMGPNCDMMLQENMVITVEPGIYIPGWGGVRIEDDVLVTQEGCEVITHAPKALIEIE